MRISSISLSLVATFLLLPLSASAVELATSTVACGGGKSSGVNHVHRSTVGQVAIGVAAGSNHVNGIGFWYQVEWLLTTGVDPLDSAPVRFWMGQNHPNPFNPTTTLKYSVPKRARVSIKLFDVKGREVRTLLDEDQAPGFHQLTVTGSGLPSGIYYFRMVTDDFVETRAMALVK